MASLYYYEIWGKELKQDHLNVYVPVDFEERNGIELIIIKYNRKVQKWKWLV